MDSGAEPIVALGAEVVASQLADLARMRAVGMALIEQVAAPATEQSPTLPLEQRALAFSRLSRAVRQIIVLEQEVLGLRCTNPRLSGIPNERRFNDARNIAAESWNARGRDAADSSDLRDRNDLYEPDDLDDYDDGDFDEGVLNAIAPIRAPEPTESDTPLTVPTPQTRAASSVPPAPVRRRAMLRGRGPPSG